MTTPTAFSSWLPALRGRLIVSCQALENEELFGADIMAKMARAAQRGGASAIRANTPIDIAAIRQAVNLPIFGLYKDWMPGFEVFITPTLSHAVQVAQAGADAICIDATDRPHPDGLSLQDYIARIHAETGLPVLADVSTLQEGIIAEDSGAEMVSTALAGYTPNSRHQKLPDTRLIAELTQTLHIPILAEGRYHTPSQAVRALRLGAYAVVVGGAITRPAEITQRFAEKIHRRS
jgi:N-acylglucosamine-6-phosphate 2-epimerase